METRPASGSHASSARFTIYHLPSSISRMHKLTKSLVFALASAPALWLGFRFLTDRLSANPIEDITLTTGIWALRFLVITIAITPLRRITG